MTENCKMRRELARLLVAFGALFICISSNAQSVSSLTSDQVKCFVGLFERIGSADLDLQLAAHNENGIEHVFDFSKEEGNLLKSTARSYRATMIQLRQSEKAISAGHNILTDADRSSIAQLIQTRNQTVKSLAEGLLKSLRPEIATALLNDVQKSIELRNLKGVK